MVGDGRDINEEINVERRRQTEDGTDSIVRGWMEIILNWGYTVLSLFSIGMKNKRGLSCAKLMLSLPS